MLTAAVRRSSTAETQRARRKATAKDLTRRGTRERQRRARDVAEIVGKLGRYGFLGVEVLRAADLISRGPSALSTSCSANVLLS